MASLPFTSLRLDMTTSGLAISRNEGPPNTVLLGRGQGEDAVSFAWASHRLRMGGARVFTVCYAASHPSSPGTMALVVWTTLPR